MQTICTTFRCAAFFSFQKLLQRSFHEMVENILTFALNTKRPLWKFCYHDLWFTISILFFEKYCRGEPNRGYKEPNTNSNILSLVLSSYNRSQIVQKGIRFLINRIRILDFCIRFKRNRIHDFNRIIRLIRISGLFNQILTELFSWAE